MNNLYYLIPTLATVIVSLLIVRVGAVALMMTGMTPDKAKFQALSAFTGTGFTTREAERVMNNPRRRKIVSLLMVLGNAGIVTVIVSATSSFSRVKGQESLLHFVILSAALGVIFIIFRKTSTMRQLELMIQKRIERLKFFEADTTVDELLHLSEGFSVLRISVAEDSAWIGRSVAEINANLDHSFVLGVERGREWLPTPKLIEKLMADDHLVIYGKLDKLAQHFKQSSQHSTPV